MRFSAVRSEIHSLCLVTIISLLVLAFWVKRLYLKFVVGDASAGFPGVLAIYDDPASLAAGMEIMTKNPAVSINHLRLDK